MPTRLIIAYSLIALLAVAAAACIGWLICHSPRRDEARRRARSLAQEIRREERRNLAEHSDDGSAA